MKLVGLPTPKTQSYYTAAAVPALTVPVHEFFTVRVRVSVLTTVISFVSFADAVIVYGELFFKSKSLEALTTN